MNYTDIQSGLKNLFSSNRQHIELPWPGISIFNLSYRSALPEPGFISAEDRQIEENYQFTYPVFAPSRKSSKVILFLHGLNERSWKKYLSWAYTLAENTSSYVVMFPLSFHINRAPSWWSNPHDMTAVMNERLMTTGDSDTLSFANAALSARMAEEPMRFFNSGYQTAMDIVDLLARIRDGRHEIIPAQCSLNIFAYSIGAFLGQILMLANPEGLLADSKLFMFCGGCVFSNMNGRSKNIMDTQSFNELIDFYQSRFEKTIADENRTFSAMFSNQVGVAFRSMIDMERFGNYRKNRFVAIRNRVRAIALARDVVIPAEKIIETLSETGDSNTVKVADFPFPYSHENPFPLLKTAISTEVDRSFESIFSEASVFLS
ncbi:MAG: DUF6051 family protein [Bacteroidales bacterium]|nr:DUF6051 family protein [Bacteroidales bacterium]